MRGRPLKKAKRVSLSKVDREALQRAIEMVRAKGPNETRWIDGHPRTSWITSTPDGRIPYTLEGLKRRMAARARAFSDFDGPESRNTSERCLLPGFSAGSAPMQNSPAALGYAIVQTKDAVVVLTEMNSEARIIRLGGRHDAPGGRVWNGDSVGHWEKDTLVVDTVGFNTRFWMDREGTPHTEQLHLVERFTRTDFNSLKYEATVDDPGAYTTVWTGGFTVEISLTSGAALNGWTLTATLGGDSRLSQGWNADWSQAGSQLTGRNAAWNGTVAAGGSVSAGFQGTYSGTYAPPTGWRLGGAPCSAIA